MEMKVVWLDSASNYLAQIYEYYKVEVSIGLARKITSKIISRTISLKRNPRIGHKEPLLENRGIEFRCIVEGNYKIIYSIEGDSIFIEDIFDCRQNPSKIKDRFSLK